MFADLQNDDWGDSSTADAWTPTGASNSDAALETLLQQVELQPRPKRFTRLVLNLDAKAR